MDALLEILGKYNCHLKRGNQSMRDFLIENYYAYVSDLKDAVNHEKNPMIGRETCDMVKEQIENVSKYADEIDRFKQKICDAIESYVKGKICDMQR